MGQMEWRYFSGDWLEILVTGPPLLLTISQDWRLNYRLRSHEQVIGKKRLPQQRRPSMALLCFWI